MTYQTLEYQVADGILTLSLNRPEQLNAFTTEMAEELIAAFERASADDAVRAWFLGALVGLLAVALAEQGGDAEMGDLFQVSQGEHLKALLGPTLNFLIFLFTFIKSFLAFLSL